MWVNSYIGIMLAYALVVAVILGVGITLAWRPSRKSDLVVQPGPNGSLHVIPGGGHVEAEDCVCGPSADGWPGSRIVEHHPLRTAQR